MMTGEEIVRRRRDDRTAFAIALAASAAAALPGLLAGKGRRASWQRALARNAAFAPWAYLLAVRPWHRQWGATDEEASAVMPGDELVPVADFETTRAVTIQAPSEAVWPWLVQMGQGRGGFYSLDRLENLVGLNIQSADRILPEYQNLAVGDTIPLEPSGSGYQVVTCDPGRLLVLYTDGKRPGVLNRELAKADAATTWLFSLQEDGPNRTRLIVRWRARYKPFHTLKALPILIGMMLEPVEFIMERQMLRGIKERAERM